LVEDIDVGLPALVKTIRPRGNGSLVMPALGGGPVIGASRVP
jgi:hypothetical protein